jgi:polysaccharide chain length determinant protein (PEP-CTERM system associated)
MHALIQQILDQILGVWRFRWMALAVAWGLSLAGFVVILLLPNTFEASGRIFVDTRTTLGEVTRGIGVETTVESQILRVRQALLGAPQLTRVAEETGLIKPTMNVYERQAVIDGLRERIEISGNLSRESSTAGVYLVSYTNRDRRTALNVVDRFVNTFVDNTLGGKKEGSEQAQTFLETQIREYEGRLSAAEGRLAEFKKRNVGLMPGTQGDYFSRLQTEQDALAKAQTNLDVATRRRDELQRQLRGESPLLTTPAGGGLVPSAPAGGSSDIATRIRETRTKLDELLLRFTDKHPDVIALRANLAELQQRQAAEIDAARRGDQGAAARTGLTANPVFQSIQLQYNQSEVELAALRGDISDRQKKVASLKALVNTAPEVEAEFARLNRDYDVTRAQHRALIERLERARVSEDAEKTGVIRFEVIEPPTASFVPVAPNRKMLIMVTLFLAACTGVGLAYLFHMLKPVFSNVRQLHEATGLPVLGMVSVTWLDKYRSAAKRGLLLYSGAAGTLLFFTFVLLLVQSRLSALIHGLSL